MWQDPFLDDEESDRKVSRFNILEHSLSAQVAAIHSATRAQLPSTLDSDVSGGSPPPKPSLSTHLL
jgi:hypothetical protein